MDDFSNFCYYLLEDNFYQKQAKDHGRKPVGECLEFCLIMSRRDVEAFSSVPRLPAWSFLRLIHGGVLPPPHSPDKSGAAVSPADKS
jgi:hypothetical protein